MIRDNCEYRTMTIQTRAKEDPDSKDCTVRGYASTFEPYVLFSDGNTDYKEQIDPSAFDDADMSDVVFLYNHDGMVFARQKNGTLKIGTDDFGLWVEADLSSTAQSRELFDAINSGLIDQMSFAFTVKEDEYDKKEHLRMIRSVGKVFDVSAVSIPANPTTSIEAVSARSYFDGVIEVEKTERLEREKALELAKAKYNYMEV